MARRRLLQSSHEVLLEAPLLSVDHMRAVYVLTFSVTNADAPVQLAELHTDARIDANPLPIL